MSHLFPAIVYILCFLTSTACAWMLGRSYRDSGARLLLWSSICFAFLAVNNLVLVLDRVVWPTPQVDLRLPRLLLSLAAAVSLIWGFISDSEES
ncbi:MAG: DUF5985 family protein [Sphingomicrobium sp.]